MIRKARFVQRRIQKIARAVTREHSSRAIPPMRRRCKSQDQQLRLRVAESRDRLAPVSPLAIRAPLFSRHFFAVAHQTRTLRASHNFLIQDTKLRELFRHVPKMAGVSLTVAVRCRASLPRTSSRKSALPTFLFQFAARLPSQHA